MRNRSNHTPRPPRVFRSACAISILFFVSAFALRAHGQQAQGVTAPSTSAAVPNLVRFSARVTGSGGEPLTGMVGVTFALYEQETVGPALWLETQSVQPNATGHYTVLLGATTPEGLPPEVFASGQARWVGAQVLGQAEQPRVMLLAVPNAMKAGDAATVGGLPPSAFMLAAPAVSNGSPATAAITSSVAGSPLPTAASNVTTSGGTANAIPLFTTATNVQNSILTQTGTAALNVGGKLNLPATGTATATVGKSSRPEVFISSSFSSSTAAAVPQTFQLQSEASGNNTATPSGTLNLLYGSGTAAPKETGFKIGNNGILTFAAGQTFPGTSKGTITGVTAGTDLTGGGTTGNITLNLDTTKIPLLTGSNNFTAPQDFKGNVGVGITLSATGYIGGFAPVFIADEITGNQFKIGGGHAGMKVSWQVTRERGFYLDPEVFGAPREKSIAWARHPQIMRRVRDFHQRQGSTGSQAQRPVASAQPIFGAAK